MENLITGTSWGRQTADILVLQVTSLPSLVLLNATTDFFLIHSTHHSLQGTRAPSCEASTPDLDCDIAVADWKALDCALDEALAYGSSS